MGKVGVNLVGHNRDKGSVKQKKEWKVKIMLPDKTGESGRIMDMGGL